MERGALGRALGRMERREERKAVSIGATFELSLEIQVAKHVDLALRGAQRCGDAGGGVGEGLRGRRAGAVVVEAAVFASEELGDVAPVDMLQKKDEIIAAEDDVVLEGAARGAAEEESVVGGGRRRRGGGKREGGLFGEIG